MEEAKNISCAKDEWEAQDHNKELRRLSSDEKKVDLVKKSDMVNKKKYEHIEQSISLLDQIRLTLRELANPSH